MEHGSNGVPPSAAPDGDGSEQPLAKRLGAGWVPPEAWKALRRSCAGEGVTPSPREIQALQGVVGGKTDAEIAAVLGDISERTVRAHREHLYAKLGCDDRASAVACVFKAYVEMKPPQR